MEVKRGDLVTVALSGDYGKPRPALIVQDDAFDAVPSIGVLPLSGDLHNAHLVRIPVEPSRQNGLERRSQVMVDKVVTVPRPKVGRVMGRLEQATMDAVDVALARFLGLE
jgi:mRNA interferase MazF